MTEIKGFYQRQKNNRYVLPTAVWNKTIWQIRDYYRLKEARNDIIYQRGSDDGTPHGSGTGDPTFQKAEKLSRVTDVVKAIEDALEQIPQEYRKGVWDNVQFRSPYPDDAARRTYGRMKARFVFLVARRLDYVSDE